MVQQKKAPRKKALKQKALCPRLSNLKDLKFKTEDIDFVFGFDEVGVACLAGPVVAACFAYSFDAEFLKTKKNSKLIRDSKQLSLEQREEAETYLLECLNDSARVFSATAEASVEEIDSINIFWACRLAMYRAYQKVESQMLEAKINFQRAALLVDGRIPPKEFTELLRQNENRFFLQDLIKGDTRVFPIAAASILAKNYRDRMMKELSQKFPDYGWESNVGYPTSVHRQALVRLGPTAHHRRSFNLDFSAGPEQQDLFETVARETSA